MAQNSKTITNIYGEGTLNVLLSSSYNNLRDIDHCPIITTYFLIESIVNPVQDKNRFIDYIKKSKKRFKNNQNIDYIKLLSI